MDSIKLNLGSFTVMFKNWINVDILDLQTYATQNGFIFKQQDVTKGIPCETNSVKAIVSSHLLEHIPRIEGFKLLKECYRVLEAGSVIRVAIPDVRKLSEVFVHKTIKGTFDYNEGVKAAKDDAEAFWNIVFAGHVTAYDANALINLMIDAGFVEVKEMPAGESRDISIRNETKDMYPDHTSYIEGIKPVLNIIPPVAQSIKRVTNLNDSCEVIDKPLNIGLVSTAFFGCPPKGYSGLEMVVWDLAEGLAELGHHVRLFAPEGSNAPKNGELVVTGPALKTTGVDWLKAEEDINKVVERYSKDLDILHGHNWFGFEYTLHGSGPRICHTHHGHLNPHWWLKSKPPYKLNFIAISKWMELQYEKLGLQSEFVYNGIDLSRYEYKETKGDRLLYVGRISKFKQPHIAIELAKRLNVGLDVVGGTFVDDPQYLEMIKNACDGKQITFNPDVSHEIKVNFMQNAKCLLFPSAMGEPFGLVAAEAMACGTPVVALNDGAISEVVEDGVTGFVLNSYNNIKSIENLNKNLALISPETCRTRVVSMFSRKTMAENYVRLYRKILTSDQEW